MSLPTIQESVQRLMYPLMAHRPAGIETSDFRNMALPDLVAILKLLPPAEQAEVAKGCGWDDGALSREQDRADAAERRVSSLESTVADAKKVLYGGGDDGLVTRAKWTVKVAAERAAEIAKMQGGEIETNWALPDYQRGWYDCERSNAGRIRSLEARLGITRTKLLSLREALGAESTTEALAKIRTLEAQLTAKDARITELEEMEPRNESLLDQIHETVWSGKNRAKYEDLPRLVAEMKEKLAGEAQRVEAARGEGWQACVERVKTRAWAIALPYEPATHGADK